MNPLLTLTAHAGTRIAEVGFLLILIAGIWLIAAETLDPTKWRKFRTVVAGVLLAAAGVLLFIATRWGQFG